MELFSNIWQHPKTSVTGVLICLVTIAGVLSQQGITLGNAGTGTMVTLIAAVATALLGLLSKDPGSPASLPTSSKLGCLALIMLLFMLPFETGCTQQQKVNVAQEIVNWTPVLVSTADTVSAAVQALDPATVLILGPVTVALNAFAPEVQKAAQAYLANPSQSTLQVLQAVVLQIQQDATKALLAAAKITNPASQALAVKDVNLVATIANTLLALVQSISTKTQVAAMAAQVHVTLAQVRPLMDQNALEAASLRVSGDLALNHAPTVNQFFAYEAQSGF
jgi:hypothetical protein